MGRTKIVCTLGPATNTPDRIEALIGAGMDCARLNFSHGSHEDHTRIFGAVRQVSGRLGRQVAILQDLQGPKIRVGRLKGGMVNLEIGQEVVITTRDVEGTSDCFQTDYDKLPSDVRVGDPVLLDDGLISLRVESIAEEDVRCRVLVGGPLSDRKGMNLPHSEVSLRAPTEKDLQDLELGCRLGVDYVALSFVQGPEDVLRLRRRLADLGTPAMPIIAKIERPLAVSNLDDIIAVSDGLMVARGDLGVEMPPEQVPGIQKTAIEKANAHGKLVIIATQMLDSMTRSPRPTRAEVSDVANAVLDGADALMLSGETAIGSYPVEAAGTMSRVIREVEQSERYSSAIDRSFLAHIPGFPNAAARAAVNAAADLGITTIAAVTESGRTAALISEYRPAASIMAFSPNPETLRRMAVFWGVQPLPLSRCDSTDEMILAVTRELLSRELCKEDEPVVLVAGVPPNLRQPTNLVKLHRLKSAG